MRILNEGKYNYVEQCNLKGLAHTRESHIITSSVTHGLLTPQQLAGNRETLHQQQSDCAYIYCACSNCENYSRAIIISLVWKNAVNTT